MKTFDEAFNAVKDSTILAANFECASEYMQNKAWVHVIETISIQLLETLAKISKDNVPQIDKNGLMIAETCSVLHGIFQCGVLTGIEMEKP